MSARSADGQSLPELTSEFRLVAACAMWPPSERRNTAIARAASAPVDWKRVFRAAIHQGLIGFVHDGLKRAGIAPPAETAALIEAQARTQLAQNLIFAAGLVRIARAFEARGISATFFKGMPTAIRLYGDIAIRHNKDIDVLVSRAAMKEASDVLECNGYRRVFPPEELGEARLHTIMRTGKDLIYHHRDNPQLEIELHWRLFNNARFMNGIGVEPVVVTFPALDNQRLRVFSADDEFAYLCAHGAAFAWCRLKWLADIGALLARENEAGLARLYESAIARGARRPAAQAMLLCRRLFGCDLPDSLLAAFAGDATVRQLETIALTAMLRGGSGESRLSDVPGGMKPIARSLWLLDPSPSYIWGELNSRWISADDVIDLPLPAGLAFAYPLLRLPLWLGRRLRRHSA